MKDVISVRGAREHNLQNVNVELPRNQLVVITGLSGSGKSSLAFDTIYAEGQRRYVESLSAYARQFLEQMGKPDVDQIDGLSPAISIEQKSSSKNPRSTVATVTEIYDYLRLLFARIGQPFCPSCGKPISAMSPQQMADQVMALPEATRFMLLAPVVRDRKGEYRKELAQFRKDGFIRVRIDGIMSDLSIEEPKLNRKNKHTIEVVIDRMVVKEGIRSRLVDSLEMALRLSSGLVQVEIPGGQTMTFSEHFGCSDCNVSYPEISPRLFSFNNPTGACPDCHGLGTKMYFDPDLLIPDPRLSLDQGAILPWSSKTGYIYSSMLEAVAKSYRFSLHTPWEELPDTVKDVVLYGTKGKVIHFTFANDKHSHSVNREFEGVVTNLERRWKETNSDYIRQELEKFMNHMTCPSCHGKRLRPEALAIRIDGRNIVEVTESAIGDCTRYFEQLRLSKKDTQIAERIIKEIRERLSFLVNVGLDYLTLDRKAATLSGGESQRIRLATQIGSMLMGVLYVLDEPSIGLHQRDNNRLLDALQHLRDQGNTVIVVEHDEDTILAADHVIDMGPGAGVHGGKVVAQGTPKEIVTSKDSLTGQYIEGTQAIAIPVDRRPPGKRMLKLHQCQANNLRGLDVSFPLGTLTCITGVSGSGKSSLIIDTLLPTLQRQLNRRKGAVNCDRLTGLSHVDKVIAIDQSPIGRTPRSNPATYTKVFTPIRELFAQLPEAKMRGYSPGRFSFNVKGGRCETCQGDGLIRIEMHFLPDIYVTCESCHGKRYNQDTLEMKWRGKNIADVLDMTVEQGMHFFENVPAIRSKLETLWDVGLGYVKLGQSATTLSGGEAQRVKLARELSKRSTGRTLYILDEPTTGLHFDDIRKLLDVLERLVETGNTVIVIEHNLDVIKTADWIIDLGPEGGSRGGKVVAQGTPETVMEVEGSYTGLYLKEKMERDHARQTKYHTGEPVRKIRAKTTRTSNGNALSKVPATSKTKAAPKSKTQAKAKAKPKPKAKPKKTKAD